MNSLYMVLNTNLEIPLSEINYNRLTQNDEEKSFQASILIDDNVDAEIESLLAIKDSITSLDIKINSTTAYGVTFSMKIKSIEDRISRQELQRHIVVTIVAL